MENVGNTAEWTRLMSAPEEHRVEAILEYCLSYIEKHDEGERTPEEVGYAVCGIGGASFKGLPDEIQQLIDLACEMEIGRDERAFFGDTTWTEEEADAKKELQYENFLALFEEIKSTVLA